MIRAACGAGMENDDFVEGRFMEFGRELRRADLYRGLRWDCIIKLVGWLSRQFRFINVARPTK